MDDGSEVATAPAIPAPRAPEPFALPESGAPPLPPAGDLPAAAPARRWSDRVPRRGGSLLFVLLLVSGVALVVLGARGLQPATPAAGSPPFAAGRRPATPYDGAVATLQAQSAALLRGDERGFLAAVDSGLRTRYRDMFRSLRALGVTRFDYLAGDASPVPGDPAGVSFRVDLRYCFGAHMCPEQSADAWAEPPHIAQTLTFRRAAGRYVIGKVATGPSPDPRQPTPWESGRLVVAEGRRVTLLAAPGQAGYLARVLPAAEAAAGVADRFAALYGTPQRRYRIYLAGEQQWKVWY